LDENGPFNIAFIPSDYIKINPIEAVGDTIEKLDVSSSFIFSSAAPLNYNYLIAVVISVGTVINNSYEISIEVV
jgi:hypothetical protein